MSFSAPTVAEFKAQFVRDFGYATDNNGDGTNSELVMDVDVTNALNMAGFNINPGLFASQTNFSIAYNLLAAHYLVTNLQASTQGLGGAGQWLTNSNSVADLASAYTIPDRIMRSPWASLISKTTYGMQYLSLIVPLLQGNVVALVRRASPF